MDGKCIRAFFSTEVNALLDRYSQFQLLMPADSRSGSSHVGEEGRFVESLIREIIKRFMPDTVEVFSGFILRPAAKTGRSGRSRREETDQHSSQLDIIVYDAAHFPVFLRFGENAVVPPEGVIGVISVKKTLRLEDVLKEAKSLCEASRLCACSNERGPIRGPFTAIVSMDSKILDGRKRKEEKVFSQLRKAYSNHTNKLDFNDVVCLVSAIKSFAVFKIRPQKSQKVAKFICFDSRNEDHLTLQLILSGLLSVYYDKTRNDQSRPGFTSFNDDGGSVRLLGQVEVDTIKA